MINRILKYIDKKPELLRERYNGFIISENGRFYYNEKAEVIKTGDMVYTIDPGCLEIFESKEDYTRYGFRKYNNRWFKVK